jgi:transcriptional regulator with XRE-family HTH domain
MTKKPRRKYEQFQQALRQVRKDAGLTQAAVAKKLGKHASFVSKCENGERQMDVIELCGLCKIYGISLCEFARRAGSE